MKIMGSLASARNLFHWDLMVIRIRVGSTVKLMDSLPVQFSAEYGSAKKLV